MRGRMLYQVRLDNGAGRIMQTGEDPDHTTWWPLADYDCPWTRRRVHSLRWPNCQKPVFVSGKTPADDLMYANPADD